MRPRFLVLLWAGLLSGQQVPFVPVTGPNAPSGGAYLFQDHKGGLWLGGTEGFRGLRYFDGTRFATPVPDDFHNIPIAEMAEDGEGGIWLASSQQGLYRVSKGKIQKMVDSGGLPTVASIAPNLLLASLTVPGAQPPQSSLTRIAKVAGTWKAESMMKSAPGLHVRPDRLGNVLYPCDDGYCEIKVADVEKWRPGAILLVAHHHWKLPFPGDYVIRDRDGCVWMRTYSTAFYQCPSDLKPVTLPPYIAGDGGRTLSQLEDGSMVIPSFGRLAIGRPGSFRVISMANGYLSYASLLVAKDGNIWLSSANGLFVLPLRSSIEFWTQRDGLDGNTWSILPWGKQVFAISGDNILKLEADRTRWRILREFAGATHLMAGPDSTIFASSRTQGVVQMDAAGRILRKSIPSAVMMLAQAPTGQVWSAGDQISRVRVGRDKLTLEPLKTMLPEGRATDIKVDRDGELWTCYSGGLLGGGPGHWFRLSRDNGLLNNGCLSLAIDQTGDIWYNSGEVDLIRRPRNAQRAIWHVSKPDEPGFGTGYFIGTDHRNQIWRGTANGVFVAGLEQGRSGQWLYLNSTDGLPGVDTNQRSFFADADGSVWFGIDSSVVHIFPSADFVHPSYAPSVFVSGFSWNGGTMQMADQVRSVPHSANLTAHFGSLQMDRRNALEFRYRLGSNGTSWTLGRDFDIRLGNLSWGNHRLEVQGRLGDGPWSKSSTASFEVSRPIWFSVPSAVGFACVSTFAIAGGARWRTKRRKRTQMPLPGLANWRSAALSPELQSLERALLDGRFKMSQMIARGGFGTVWRASDRQQDGRPCAVKVFRRELLDNDWRPGAFSRKSRPWSASTTQTSFEFTDTERSAAVRRIWPWSSLRAKPCARN